MSIPNANTAHLVNEIDHLCSVLVPLEERNSKISIWHKQGGGPERNVTDDHVADLRGRIQELRALVDGENASQR